jgi:hypothetical protein
MVARTEDNTVLVLLYNTPFLLDFFSLTRACRHSRLIKSPNWYEREAPRTIY